MNLLQRISTIGAFALALGAHGQTWDLKGDWAPTNNPNGQWSYGAVNGGVFTPLAWTGVSYGVNANGNVFIYQNNTGSLAYGVQPGDITLEADWGNAAAQWTAPTAGRYSFTIAMGGTLQTAGGGYGNNFAQDSVVTVNGVGVGANSSIDNGSINMKSWSFAENLGAGSTVDAFVINPGFANGGNVDTNFTVNAVPEPAPFAALGIGALALLRRRRQA